MALLGFIRASGFLYVLMGFVRVSVGVDRDVEEFMRHPRFSEMAGYAQAACGLSTSGTPKTRFCSMGALSQPI